MTTAPADATADFGDLLRRARIAAGLTQEELAERARVSARGISDLERGVRRRPHPSTLRLVLEALAPPEDLRRQLQAAARTGLADGARRGDRLPGVALTRRIGRDALVAEVLAAVTGHDRLVNLVGVGGVGKTRVALAVADAARGLFKDGVLTVWLAPLTDPGLVPGAIARAAGIADSVDRPVWPRLLNRLQSREALIVLDNFEHLLAAAPALLELCAAAPGVRLLLTSRVRLHAVAERAIAVPPLAVEDAAALFVARARAAGATTDPPGSSVAEICRRLDCLPLAIELAASRTAVLSVDELLRRLAGNRLEVLAGAPIDLPARQRTLRDTIAWSVELLDDSARRLLAGCAVCPGGWTLELAEAIYGGSCLEPLARLVDHQLVRREADGRYSMLETIREFAAGMRDADAAVSGVHERLSAHLLDFLEDADTHLFGGGQADQLDRIEAELPNIRAALEWAVATGRLEVAAGIASRMAWPWLIRGHLHEGRSWLERVLGAGGALPERLLGRTELALAMLLWSLAEYQPAVELSTRAAERLLAAGDPTGAATALNYVARCAVDTSRLDLAASSLERAIELYSRERHTWGVYFSQAQVARVEWAAGRHGDARRRLEEWLPVIESHRDWRGMGFFLAYLSGVTRDAGDPAAALVTGRRSLGAFERIGDRRGKAIAQIAIAAALRDSGDLDAAGATFRQCLELLRDVGPRLEIAWALEQMAPYESRRGAPERARRIGEAAAAIRAEIGAPLPDGWRLPVRYSPPAGGALGATEAIELALDG